MSSTTQPIEADLIRPDVENAEMGYALQLVTSTNCNVFLTGKAGTGKSSLLRYICATTKKAHVVLAPTGLAALNVGGQTIHSFFHLPLEPISPTDAKMIDTIVKKRLKKDEKKLIKQLELIVVDEVSMVRADLIDILDKVLRRVRGHPTQIFGGLQMLFVGDLYQLEPVVSPDERQILDRFYRSPYFFSAAAFEGAEIVPIELHKVYRQEELQFVRMLDRIRTGSPTPSDIELLNRRVAPGYHASQEEMVITLCNTRRRVSEINEYHLSKQLGKEFISQGIINGDMPERSLPTDAELKLKEGAQIIFVQNDPAHQWVNGSLGAIQKIDQESATITVLKDDGKVVRVSMSVWNNVKYRYNEETKSVESEVVGSFQQYPIKLAWAITIHKSQGLTFERVIIDFGGGSFAAGQAYVALSRCRTLQGIILRQPFNPFGIIVREEVSNFYRKVNDSKQISLALAQAQAERSFVQAARLVSAGKLNDAATLFAKALGSEANIFTDHRANRLLRYKLAEVAAIRQQKQDLERELRERDRLAKDFANEYIDMGLMCMDLEEYEAAARNFRKALKLKPQSRRAKHALAKALEKIKETDD